MLSHRMDDDLQQYRLSGVCVCLRLCLGLCFSIADGVKGFVEISMEINTEMLRR